MKNKKMLVIVGSLLLVVGVSLAYFVAGIILGGEGAKVSGTTATLNDAELHVEGTLEFNDLDVYPGHKTISSIKLTATGDNILVPYNLIWEGTNTINTPLNYTVYKTSSSIDVSVSCFDYFLSSRFYRLLFEVHECFRKRCSVHRKVFPLYLPDLVIFLHRFRLQKR